MLTRDGMASALKALGVSIAPWQLNLVPTKVSSPWTRRYELVRLSAQANSENDASDFTRKMILAKKAVIACCITPPFRESMEGARDFEFPKLPLTY